MGSNGLVATMLELIAIDSPTRHAAAIGDDLSKHFQEIGCNVERVSTGGTNANEWNAAGLPTVAISTGLADEHALGEHTAINGLHDAGRWVLSIVTEAATLEASPG